VEVVTALIFALLPAFISALPDLIVNSFYVAVLMLVIVIDLEHRLILNVVTFPVTLLALLGSTLVTPEENTFLLALVGAIVGYLLFYAVYWLARLLYGPGAIGAGDVKLAMAMGAMLGFHRIFFALILAILLGGIGSLVLLLTRRVGRHSYTPYGQYLAIAAIVMLIWGTQVVEWYTN
jgi:prepilin signal peptidase PulO-like enzyme (type II secretory pathway)